MDEIDYADDAAMNWKRLRGEIDLSRYVVAMRIMRLSGVLQAKLDEALDDAGFAVLGDYEVMSALRRADRPLLPSDIADRLKLTRAGVTGRLHRLEAAGMVTRERSADDSRNVLVKLTPRGRKTTDRGFERVVACDDDLLANLTDRQVATLGELLGRIGVEHDALLSPP